MEINTDNFYDIFSGIKSSKIVRFKHTKFKIYLKNYKLTYQLKSNLLIKIVTGMSIITICAIIIMVNSIILFLPPVFLQIFLVILFPFILKSISIRITQILFKDEITDFQKLFHKYEGIVFLNQNIV